MQSRVVDDRRVKKNSVAIDKRNKPRRKEDISNNKAYYSMLVLSVGTLIFIGIISFIWGR